MMVDQDCHWAEVVVVVEARVVEAVVETRHRAVVEAVVEPLNAMNNGTVCGASP